MTDVTPLLVVLFVVAEAAIVVAVAAAIHDHVTYTQGQRIVVDLPDNLLPLATIRRDEDKSFSVEIAAMPGHVGAGETVAEALEAAHDAALAWIEADRCRSTEYVPDASRPRRAIDDPGRLRTAPQRRP